MSDFLFGFLDDEKLTNKSLLLKGRICSNGSKFLPLRVDSSRGRRHK